MKRQLLSIALSLFAFAVTGFAATDYSLFGDASIVSPGNASLRAVQIRSSATIAPGYGGIDLAVPAGLTIAGLNNLSTDFKAVAGGCAGGAPRFVAVSASGDVSFYIGAPPSYLCPPDNLYHNSGNLASPLSLVDATHYPVGTFYMPYPAFQAAYGSEVITQLFLVTDGSWAVSGGIQTFHIDNTMINSTLINYEPPVATNADQCKNGGWQNVFRADGSPFKNQGDCVSYTRNGK